MGGDVLRPDQQEDGSVGGGDNSREPVNEELTTLGELCGLFVKHLVRAVRFEEDGGEDVRIASEALEGALTAVCAFLIQGGAEIEPTLWEVALREDTHSAGETVSRYTGITVTAANATEARAAANAKCKSMATMTRRYEILSVNQKG